jgi:hypothetical protein
MRALDPIVTADNIRIAAIHPWFAGIYHAPLSPPLALHADPTRLRKDTAILGLPLKLMLAGIPLTPIPRIAGAIFRAATDPDLKTSGCPWVLPDDGPVIRVEKEALRAGVYKMLSDRVRRVSRYVPILFCLSVSCASSLMVFGPCFRSFATAVRDWLRLVRDLAHIFRPLLIVAVPVGGLAVAVSRGLITIPF